MPKPVSRRSTGPPSGSAARWRCPATCSSAAESAYMKLAFVNIGLVPDGGALPLISTRAGAGRATNGAARRTRLGGRGAALGTGRRGAPDDAFQTWWASPRRASPPGPRSYAGSKRLLNAWLYAGLEEQLELEARVQQEMAASADFLEGVDRLPPEAPAEVRRPGTANTPASSPSATPHPRGGSRAHRRCMNTMPAALAPARTRTRRRVFTLTLLAAIMGVLTLAGSSQRTSGRPNRAARRTPTASTRSTRSCSPSRRSFSSASRASCCTR